MFQVRKMSKRDFTFAVRLSDTMNWNLVEEDFDFVTKLEPDGCFILLYGLEKIGIATTMSFGKIGWLGNVIVEESSRGKGGGSLLVTHAINYLKKKGVETIGIYGYLERINFYKRHSFVYNSEFIVLKGKGYNSTIKSDLREFKKDDINAIITFDSACFGASRRKLLKPLLLNSDNLCYISENTKGILGFVITKVYGNAAEIGPLVCRQGCEDIALDLLKSILNKLTGFDISLCISEKEFIIINALKESGFREDFRLAEMFHGYPIIKNCIYVTESLERG